MEQSSADVTGIKNEILEIKNELQQIKAILQAFRSETKEELSRLRLQIVRYLCLYMRFHARIASEVTTVKKSQRNRFTHIL